MNRVMIIARAVLLLVVIAVLLLPGNNGERAGVQIAVLVDQSDSVSSAAVARVREQLAAQLRSQRANIEVSAFAYGAADTDLNTAEALRETLWKMRPASRTGIVVISDGYWRSNVTPLLQRMLRADVPVYWLPAESNSPRPRIVRIDAPDRARLGQHLPVSVDVAAPESADLVVVLYANGEPVGRLPLLQNERVTLQVSIPEVDELRLDAELVDADTGQSQDRLLGGALVNVASAPHLLVIANGISPIGDSLAAGGWSVTQISPRAFAGLVTPISRYSALILDDVATTDMPDDAWASVVAAVRRNALGLLVLGGPNSFGLGAYRGSVLEDVLPVISEPPEDETPANVVFLIDVSGSMGRRSGGADRLRIARDAVLHTAAALRPTDRVGLIGFDVESRQLLSLARRDDHAAAIRRAWPEQASGGTSMIPALDLALSALASDRAEQQLVVLVTDGMLPPTELTELETRLQQDNFDFIAMVLSDEGTESPLSRIQLSDRGWLLLVDNVLRLPALMRNEVEDLRPALVSGRTSPVVASPLPWSHLPANWPALDAYLVTRARPEATVMLAAGRGEPLLAAWTASAGRVVTLTGGLNHWATEWLEWPMWAEFSASLINYIAVTDSALVRLDTEIDSQTQPSILLDNAAADDMAGSLPAQLLLPSGRTENVVFVPEGPRLYRSSVSMDQVGQYTLLWESDAGVNRYSFLRMPEREPTPAAEPVARKYLNEGLLKDWNAESVTLLASRATMKTALIAIALAILLMTIAAERVPASSLRRLSYLRWPRT